VVLNSGSNDLTYIPHFTSPNPVSRSILTGGINPVAAVMGDFNGDGLNDLVVAHGADSRITLLEGSTNGPVYMGGMTLTGSVRLTDLVSTGVSGGKLQLFAGAEGLNQTISLSFSVSQGASLSATGGIPSPTITSSGGELVFNSTQETTTVSSQQQGTSQAAAAAATSAANVSSATTGVVGISTGSITSAILASLSASVDSLGGVVDNLLKKGQAQVSDILPLENNEVATVAVLLLVSNSLGDDSSGEGILESADGKPFQPEKRVPTSRSPLELVLCDAGGIQDALPVDFGGHLRERVVNPSDWVWRPTGSGMETSNVERKQSSNDKQSPTKEADEEVVELESVAEVSETNHEPSFVQWLTWGQITSICFYVMAVIILSYRVLSNRIRTMMRARRVEVDPLSVNGPANPSRTRRTNSKSLELAKRTSKDLPPWLHSAAKDRSKSKNKVGILSSMTRYRRPGTSEVGRNSKT